MRTYLGIDHHRLGPPPDWRNYRKGWLGLRFDWKSYVRDVELYIRLTHIHHFHMDITDYDNLSTDVGESACSIERTLKNVLEQVQRFARRYDSVAPPDALTKREERWQQILEEHEEELNQCLEEKRSLRKRTGKG